MYYWNLACYDEKPGSLKAGQADGLQPRTLEVLKSLDFADEILNHTCLMSEVAFWNPKQGEQGACIECTSVAPDVVVAARYKREATIHQDRIERILEDNINQYSPGSIRRHTKFLDYQTDAASDSEFPLRIELEVEDARVSKHAKRSTANT